MTDAGLAAVIALLDRLEDERPGYLTLEEVVAVESDLASDLDRAIAQDVVLVDYRQRYDDTTGTLAPVVLCRLNRRHPLVRGETPDAP